MNLPKPRTTPTVMAIIKPLTLYSAIKLNIIAFLYYPYRMGDLGAAAEDRVVSRREGIDLRGTCAINPTKFR